MESFSPSIIRDLKRGVGNFLLHYRNSADIRKQESLDQLSKRLILRFRMRALESADLNYRCCDHLLFASEIVPRPFGNRMAGTFVMDSGSKL